MNRFQAYACRMTYAQVPTSPETTSSPCYYTATGEFPKTVLLTLFEVKIVLFLCIGNRLLRGRS